MPHDLLCPECGGPLKEARHLENLTCRLCNAEVAVQNLDEICNEGDALLCLNSFDPLLDEDLNAQIDEEYDRLLIAEGWPEPGNYVDSKTGVSYTRPVLPWPSKARNLITGLYDMSVQVRLLDKVEEVILSTVMPMISRAVTPGVLMIKDLGDQPSGIVPRYFKKAMGETKGNRFTISFAIPFILTPEARRIRKTGMREQVEVVRDAIIRTLDAMKPMLGGSTLKNTATIEAQADSMMGLMGNSKPAEVAMIMMRMAIPKKDFKEESWDNIKARLVNWQ